MMATFAAWYQRRLRSRRLVLSEAPDAPPADLAHTQPGWAVRRDWPDGRHEFIRFRGSAAEAEKQAAADLAYWRRGPMRPEVSVVQISRHDFTIHHARTFGPHPDCPRPCVREEATR